MKKTYITTMPDHVGAFLQACKLISAHQINITRVSYNKAVDMHILFIEVEGDESQLETVTRSLAQIGYLPQAYAPGSVLLLEFLLRDIPGSVQPILELIDRYQFNISYISSAEDATAFQRFKMGLFVKPDSPVTDFLSQASRLCTVRVLDYDKTEKHLDNTVFYLTFASEIAKRLQLGDAEKNALIVQSNCVMQVLDERDCSPYKKFDYISAFADAMIKYRGDQFCARASTRQSRLGLSILVLEPPCGSNVTVLHCNERLLVIDGGFACYRAEMLQALRQAIPDWDERQKECILTHADVDHCGLADEFSRVWVSRACFDNFEAEHQGQSNLREQNPLHAPFVLISKLLSGYRPPALSALAVLGGNSGMQRETLSKIADYPFEDLLLEVYQGGGGHSGGEIVLLERKHGLVFTGDLFVNVKAFTPQQAAFNRLAPYLMTSVDRPRLSFAGTPSDLCAYGAAELAAAWRSRGATDNSVISGILPYT